MIPESEMEESSSISQNHLAKLAEEVARRLNQVSGQAGSSGRGNAGTSGGGIAPETRFADYGTTPGFDPKAGPAQPVPQLTDRGIYHAADAMREMYEMGDAPSCSVCGAIMVRNGSCYRCMSCGSTSGCS
jgi:ribonucleoside-diphosphate reductase alpha chain